MDKGIIIAEMHTLVVSRLFGSGRWLADYEVNRAVNEKLDQWGLQEWISDDTKRATQLGNELELDLIMVFAGAFNELEIPIILEEHGLLDEDRSRRAFRGIGSDRTR